MHRCKARTLIKKEKQSICSLFFLDTGFPNKNLLAGAAASQCTSMTQWRAYDNNLYFYAMLDFIFPPPPPPHPWSTYKAVGVYVGLMYNTFQKAFDEFGRDHPEKIAFLVELKSGIVYASTYGGMARAECTPRMTVCAR